MMRVVKHTLMRLAAMLFVAASASAQPLSNLVFTVGTTIQDASQQNWSYVVLGSPQGPLLAGKRFAVYGKTGLPADPGSFNLRATIFQQTDPAALQSLLNQSVALGEDLGALGDLLNLLFRNVPGIATMPLPQKVIASFEAAAGDANSAPELMILARLHPGLILCSGLAFAEVINAVTTYEVREVDPATGAAAEVIGRVTITPGAPVVLPAPGFPFQVVTNAPSDHLRIRLRWGTPDELRRLSLLQFGFNVWRIPRAVLFTLANPNPSARFFGLRADRAASALFEEWRVTPPVGLGFGPGPQFSITADVVPNATYHISVAAEDASGGGGDASAEWTFTWRPPPTNLTVPWPARPLPPVTLFDEPSAVTYPDPGAYSPRVAAVLLTYYDQAGAPHPDANYPVGIRFAELYGSYQPSPNIGNTNFATYYGLSDPNIFVFKRYSLSSDQNGQPLLPIVVYRQQATNANFPRVSGNVTQVTPLLERIPWIRGSGLQATIPHRHIALSYEDYDDRGYYFLYLRDQQPVILGARYQYYVVRLNDQREVSEVIDAGTVDIPTAP